jgi:putative phage-type endonuclease
MSLTEQQLAERHTGLGGSDAAAALGLSPYKSALELFLEKRERRDLSAPQVSAFRWGNLLEPVIRQEYANVTHRNVLLPEGTLRHPTLPFVIAHVDGITEDKRVFEAKTSRTDQDWGKSGSDDVPHHYLLQVQHYLAVTGLLVADIAVLIGGNDFRIFEVPADRELQNMILEGEVEFWSMVERGEPPSPDFDRPNVYDLVRKLYPGTDGRTVTATDDDYQSLAAYRNADEFMKSYAVKVERAKAQLLDSMGEAAKLVFPDAGVQLQRKQIERKAYSVDAKTYVDSRFTKLKEIA